MTDFDKALADPQGVYEFPKNVLEDQSLTDDQKIKVLRQWEYDARGLLVADEENMSIDTPSMLNRIRRALTVLGAESEASGGSNKHGG